MRRKIGLNESTTWTSDFTSIRKLATRISGNNLMIEQKFPPGWGAQRVQRLIAHYEELDEDVQVAEDEAAHEAPNQTVMVVPTDLVPAIRQMIAQRS